MTREELIADFKEFMSQNRSDAEKHIIPIEDISLDDDWFADDGWDEVWRKERMMKKA